jgi:hypothetical protein
MLPSECPILALDVDMVLLDYLEGFVAWLRSKGYHVTCEAHEIEDWDFGGVLPGVGRDEFIGLINEFATTPEFGRLGTIKGAREAIKAIREEFPDLEIVAITSAGSEPVTEVMRRSNLEMHDFGISSVTVLPLGASKRDNLLALPPGSIFIDDLMKNVKVAEECGLHAVLFRHPYNAKEAHHLCAGDWSETVDLIRRLVPVRPRSQPQREAPESTPMNTDGIDYKARYEELASALGIDCGASTGDGIDHAAALEQGKVIKSITDGIPDACVDTLRSIIDAASASGYRARLREMVNSASDRAAGMPDAEAAKASGSPLTHLFGKAGSNLSSEVIPNIDKVFEIMAAADAARASEPKAPAAHDRLNEIIEMIGADAVLALVEAARKLPAGDWWLDEGRPWRLMVNLMPLPRTRICTSSMMQPPSWPCSTTITTSAAPSVTASRPT